MFLYSVRRKYESITTVMYVSHPVALQRVHHALPRVRVRIRIRIRIRV